MFLSLNFVVSVKLKVLNDLWTKLKTTKKEGSSQNTPGSFKKTETSVYTEH